MVRDPGEGVPRLGQGVIPFQDVPQPSQTCRSTVTPQSRSRCDSRTVWLSSRSRVPVVISAGGKPGSKAPWIGEISG